MLVYKQVELWMSDIHKLGSNPNTLWLYPHWWIGTAPVAGSSHVFSLQWRSFCPWRDPQSWTRGFSWRKPKEPHLMFIIQSIYPGSRLPGACFDCHKMGFETTRNWIYTTFPADRPVKMEMEVQKVPFPKVNSAPVFRAFLQERQLESRDNNRPWYIIWHVMNTDCWFEN